MVLPSKQSIKYIKTEYCAAFCDPDNHRYPKIIEIRNRLDVPPPYVGDYLELGGLNGCEVMQVGGFENLQSWHDFPFKFEGGVGLDRANPDDIHNVALLTREDFASGLVWWALLKFIPAG